MPNSTGVTGGTLGAHTTVEGHSQSVLLRVLGLASGVCRALGPEFPEVAHRGPSLNWSGEGISPLGELLTFVLCPCMCVCICACTQCNPYTFVYLHECTLKEMGFVHVQWG